MRSKLYRNTKKFSLYTNKLYINVFSYKVLRDNFFINISDRAIFSNFIRSRRTNLCNFKNHCFFTSNGKSVYSDFLFSRFELKRRAMSGSIVGIKVASWLFFFMYKFYSAVGLFNICKSSKVRTITVPKSRVVRSFLLFLKKKGYLHCFLDLGAFYRIVLNSKASNFRFTTFSRPSKPIYFSYKDVLLYNRKGFNFIFSTPYGIVDSSFCLEKKIGGQPLLKFVY